MNDTSVTRFADHGENGREFADTDVTGGYPPPSFADQVSRRMDAAVARFLDQGRINAVIYQGMLARTVAPMPHPIKPY